MSDAPRITLEGLMAAQAEHRAALLARLNGEIPAPAEAVEQAQQEEPAPEAGAEAATAGLSEEDLAMLPCRVRTKSGACWTSRRSSLQTKLAPSIWLRRGGRWDSSVLFVVMINSGFLKAEGFLTVRPAAIKPA